MKGWCICPAQRHIVLRSRGTRLRHIVAKMAGSVARHKTSRLDHSSQCSVALFLKPRSRHRAHCALEEARHARIPACCITRVTNGSLTRASTVELNGQYRMDPGHPARVIPWHRVALRKMSRSRLVREGTTRLRRPIGHRITRLRALRMKSAIRVVRCHLISSWSHGGYRPR